MDSAILVERATRGDQPALDELVAMHVPRLRAWLRLRAPAAVLARESTSDLVQSVCREALDELGRFEWRGEPAFRAWLYTKAATKLVDRLRHWQAQRRAAAGPELRVSQAEDGELAGVYLAAGLTPSRVAIGREDLARFEQALAELPEDQREVLALVRIAGLSQAEVATHLGRSEGSVRGLLQRALRRLSWVLSREQES